MDDCRSPIETDDAMPRLFVRCVGDREPELVQYIEHGIEEEGVPWVVQHGYDGDGVSVAYDASVTSSLKIGIGVAPDSRVVVHHKQLPDDDPVFDRSDVTAKTARALGSNSARLVKGTPLKPLE